MPLIRTTVALTWRPTRLDSHVPEAAIRPLQQPNATLLRSELVAPRRHGLRPRLVAAVVPSTATSAFAAFHEEAAPVKK
jgi:hypothetical protein